MSRGRWNGLETALEKGNSPAVKDLVQGSGLNQVKTVHWALTGPLRWKKPRNRLSESSPKRSVQVQERVYRRNATLKREKALPLQEQERSKRGEFQRKEELYKRLEALVTPSRTSVLDSISWTSGRLQATNASIR